MNIKLKDVLVKYADHPDFIGIELTDPNQEGAVDDTPLHIAARKGSIEDIGVLLEHGADINKKGDLGNTPLHFAALAGRKQIALFLLSRGANKKLLNEFEQTAKRVAELEGEQELAKVL